MTTTTCNTCNKSTLSLLLLRPGPIAKSGPLHPAGADAVASDAAAMSGLLPTKLPTESRFALRLLRPGYVHVYIASPPSGVKNWLVYRVTDQADLVPENNDWFAQPTASITCSRQGHNAAGLKLLNIPQAHKISELWIAYSANLWNDALRNKNKANPQVMQKINLAGGSPNTFKPTADNLRRKVLECALTKLKINEAADHDFVFNSLATQVDSLVENLEKAAALHPKTKGKEQVVVLRDPVGIATELNELRLRRHEVATREIEKPENAHPLNSSNALLGMQKVVLDTNELDSYEQVSPLRLKANYASKSWPVGTEWQPLTPEDRQTLLKRASGSMLLKPYKDLFAREDMGRVIYADHDERAAAWARKLTEKTWVKLAPHYDEGARATWVKTFEAKMKSAHYEPLEKFENDWLAATQDAKTLDYFARHFDANDSNSPLSLVSAGKIYASESQLIHQPAPLTTGTVLDTYLAMLGKPITDEAAVVQRALVGNQQEVITVIHAELTGDAGADGVRDKSYDFMKGVLGLGSGKAALKKYGWLGDAVGMFSVGQLSALSGALMSAAGRSPAMSAALEAQLAKVQQLWGVQQAVEYAAASALQGKAPAMPVLITMRVDAKEALIVLRARKNQNVGTSKSRIKKQGKAGTKITLTLLTDTDSLKAAQGDVNKLLQDPAHGGVQMGAGAKAAVAASTVTVLSEKQFLSLYAKQSTLGAQAVNAVRQSLQTGAGAQAVRAISMSLDGRLAIGSIIVQGIGLINGVKALEKAKTAKEVRDAWYGIYDSTAGVLGGLLEMWAVAAQASTLAKAGQQAVAKGMGIASLRFVANIAGAAGGVVMMVSSFAKAKDAEAAGDAQVQGFYKYSGYAFLGTGFTSVAIGAGFVADTLVARSVGGAVVRTIALRVGAAGALGVVGGTALTVSGIGLMLLGAGVAFQLTAIALTPTPMQRWMGRSYFGKDPSWFDWDGKREDMFAKGDWKAESKALLLAIKEAAGDTPASSKPAPLTAQATAAQ